MNISELRPLFTALEILNDKNDKEGLKKVIDSVLRPEKNKMAEEEKA